MASVLDINTSNDLTNDETISAITTIKNTSSKKVDITLKLPQLQNCCKRDPKGYQSDYDAQIRRLESECHIFYLNGANGNTGNRNSGTSPVSSDLVELIQFAAAVSSSSYKGKESDRIINILTTLLLGPSSSDNATASSTVVGDKTIKSSQILSQLYSSTASNLNKDIRKAAISGLILMRRKGALDPLRLYDVSFRLIVSIQDKRLREYLQKQLILDVANVNKVKKKEGVNIQLQSFLHKIIQASCASGNIEEGSVLDVAPKRAVQILSELYRRKVWTDTRTISILSTAITSSNLTVMATALRFFLNIEEKMDHDIKSSMEEEQASSCQIQNIQHCKKTKKKLRLVEKQKKERAKAQNKKEHGEEAYEYNILHDKGVHASKKLYPAIEMLHDAQSLAEKVLKRLKSSPVKISFVLKLLMMNFVTRLVGNHQLTLLNLYPFLQRYMSGYQRDVTAILAYTVQACHEHVPPEEIYGVLQTILNNFVTERCSEEQMAVGINAIRAICSRVPSILVTDDADNQDAAVHMDIPAFVQDIASYAKHRDKSISTAGRAFVNFIREVYPSLLVSKDRGEVGSALHKHKQMPLKYGQTKVNYGVEGADLLVEYEAKKAARKQAMENELADDEDEEEQEEAYNDVNEENEESDNDDNPEDDDEEAPSLINLDEVNLENVNLNEIDITKLTAEQRNELSQKVSSTRIFSASDFIKMRKLLARQEKLKRDPRAAARLKRLKAQGREDELLLSGSDDDNSDEDISDSDSDSDDEIHIKGAVNPDILRSTLHRKKMNKVERLAKVIAGREQFIRNSRQGGSTNIEKNRKKLFTMTKHSDAAQRKRLRGTMGLSKKKRDVRISDPRKRRRKF